uniref:hypothetical protein n=1 Tax=Stenotrophomonas sp. Ste71 TaxID=2926027 RepID=UPI002117CE55
PRILMVGTMLMVVAAASLLLVDRATGGFIPLIPTMFLYTLGFGSCMPSAQVLALQNHRADSGVAASLMGAGNMLMAASVGPIIGRFELRDATPMAVAMLVLALASTTVLWLVVRPRQLVVDLD